MRYTAAPGQHPARAHQEDGDDVTERERRETLPTADPMAFLHEFAVFLLRNPMWRDAPRAQQHKAWLDEADTSSDP